MIVRPLSTNERAEMPGYTHVGIIDADDVTNATVTTAQAITLCALKKGDILLRAIGYPKAGFQNTADSANNSTTASLGDTGSATRYLAAGESNANAAGITPVIGNTPYLLPAADSLQITVTPKTGTALNVLNRGEYHVYFALCRPSIIANAIGASRIDKT